MGDKDVTWETVHEGRITRRRMLFGAAGAIGAAAFLAACGGDDDDDAGSERHRRRRHHRRHDGGTTARRHRRDDRRHRRHDGGAAGSTDLPTLLGVDEASAGAGKTIDLGAVLALTGTGSFYGKTMSRGLDLAAKHIAEARRADVQLHVPRPQVGRCRRRRAGDGRARLEGRPGQVRVLRRRPRRDARRPPPRTRCSRSTAAAARASSARASRTSGAPGRSRRTTRCPACSSGARRPTRTRRRVGLVGWDIGEPNNTHHQGGHPRQDRGRRHGVQRPLRAGARRRPGLLPGAAQDQGQRARPPARQHLRPGPRLVRQPGRDGRPDRHPHRLRVHARRRQRLEGHVRLATGYTFAYDYFDAKHADQPAGQDVRRGLQRGVRRGPGLLRRQLLRERVRDVGADAAHLGRRPGGRDHRRGARRRAAREPHGRQRVRRRRRRPSAPTPSTRRPTP